MAIPDFQSIMLPLLAYISNKEMFTNQDIADHLADYYLLTEHEKYELLPSGKQRVFLNRIAWAKSHLKQAGLIISPKRGFYKISDRGLKLLDRPPERIDIKYLKRYPEYVAFRAGKNGKHVKEDSSESKTPQEYIEYGYKQIENELSEAILYEVRSSSPYRFERIVVDLLLAMGYGGSRAEAGQVTRSSGDGGIDGIINEDKLGLDVIYIQAKRWEGTVGRPEIQKFAGALMGKKAKKGIFITTSAFTSEAEQYARDIDSRLILIDGERLAKLMIEHNVGVSVAHTYEIKKVDSDYFLEE